MQFSSPRHPLPSLSKSKLILPQQKSRHRPHEHLPRLQNVRRVIAPRKDAHGLVLRPQSIEQFSLRVPARVRILCPHQHHRRDVDQCWIQNVEFVQFVPRPFYWIDGQGEFGVAQCRLVADGTRQCEILERVDVGVPYLRRGWLFDIGPSRDKSSRRVVQRLPGVNNLGIVNRSKEHEIRERGCTVHLRVHLSHQRALTPSNQRRTVVDRRRTLHSRNINAHIIIRRVIDFVQLVPFRNPIDGALDVGDAPTRSGVPAHRLGIIPQRFPEPA
mmetsp:Transcript_6300/g.13714  ORF Transcript_6300/g.13714 Transcript_6300/m.13714 type:complete len:272 (+) Transcript_6300:116-931(+)